MMIAAVRAYVDKMLEIPEMKVVLLDPETVCVLQLGTVRHTIGSDAVKCSAMG